MVIPPTPEPPGRRIAREAIEAEPERLDSLTRKARRVLAQLNVGMNDHSDVIVSAIKTLLRRQDPNASLRKNEFPDPPIGAADDVWPLLQKHFERKLDTAKHQYRVAANKAQRATDMGSEEGRELWVNSILDDSAAATGDDDAIVESYLADVLATMRELVGDEAADSVDRDPLRLEVMRLWVLGHSQRAIAEHLGVTHARVRQTQGAIKRLLQDYEVAEGFDDRPHA